MAHEKGIWWRGLALSSAISLCNLSIVPAQEPANPPEPGRIAVQEGAKAAPASDVPAAEAKSDVAVEIITERFPNRSVKIERHVAQDGEGNYYNHGLWTQWDKDGALLGTGEYKNGQREGKWIRWFEGSESSMFTDSVVKQFQAPFVAEATFTDGRLDGKWLILDSKNRKVSEFEFAHGELHGKCTWYFPDGQKRREVDYKNGQLDGESLEWSVVDKAAGKQAAPAGHSLVSKGTYENGRRHGQQIEWFAPGQKKVEGWYMHAREITAVNADFWKGVFETKVTGKDGADQKHGKWTWWYKDGGKQLEGEYSANDPVGVHTWWHANGQKHIEGAFESGKQTGKWVWWYPNGQKHIEGHYVAGEQSGQWTKWNEEGKVLEVQDVAVTTQPLAAPADDEGARPVTAQVAPKAPTLRVEMTQRARSRATLKR